MDKKLLLIAISLVTGLFLTSCEKDDPPQITDVEVGTSNSKIGIIGSDLHLEAEIVAEEKIFTVTVEIHPEGTQTWEFDSIYTEFSELKNCTFHKHIDIPLTAEAGDYHLHLIVVDLSGNETTVESELEIQVPSDANAPTITISTAPTTNQAFASGQTISISGSVSDDISLAGIYIGLVREGQSLADADVNATNTITVMHTHDFDSPTSHSFLAGIIVGANQDNNITPKDITGDIAWQSANYYILVKCKDQFGGNWSYSSHYPIIINY